MAAQEMVVLLSPCIVPPNARSTVNDWSKQHRYFVRHTMKYSIWLRLWGLWLACIDAGWKVGRLGFEMCPEFGSSCFRPSPVDLLLSCYFLPLVHWPIVSIIHLKGQAWLVLIRWTLYIRDRGSADPPAATACRQPPPPLFGSSHIRHYASPSSKWLLCGVFVVVTVAGVAKD